MNTTDDTNDLEKQEPLFQLSDYQELVNHDAKLMIIFIENFISTLRKNLALMTEAVKRTKYEVIEKLANTLSAFVIIIKIDSVLPFLDEMKELAQSKEGIKRITFLNTQLHYICWEVIDKLEEEVKKLEGDHPSP